LNIDGALHSAFILNDKVEMAWAEEEIDCGVFRIFLYMDAMWE